MQFNEVDCDADVEIFDDGSAVRSTIDQWRGVRGHLEVADGKVGTFRVSVVSGTVRVGWGAIDSSRMLGTDDKSFGYGGTGKRSHAKKYLAYGEPFGEGDVITCNLDRRNSGLRLSFSKNGVDLGMAFEYTGAEVPAFVRGVPLRAGLSGRIFEARVVDGIPAPLVAAGVGAAYAAGQLQRAEEALGAAGTERQAERVAAWQAILDGQTNGTLQVGSRQPLGCPVWVTPHVERGGFASGAHMAGGAIQQHERDIAARLQQPVEGAATREHLNNYFAQSPEGLAELELLLESGCYRIIAPEEAALLVTVHLRRSGVLEEAAAILAELRPWFEDLRFFPVPAGSPAFGGPVVSLSTVAGVSKQLAEVVERGRVQGNHYAIMRRSILEVTPICDEIVALVSETFKDGVARPTLADDSGITGGWPFQVYPTSWFMRAQEQLKRFEAIRRFVPKRKHAHHFALCLRNAVDKNLTKQEVGLARRMLAQINMARGLPGDPRHTKFRVNGRRSVEDLPHGDCAAALLTRLGSLPRDEGLDADVFQELAEGQPKAIAAKLRRALRAGLQELVDLRVLTSAEVLAKLATAVAADVGASAHETPELQRLDRALYMAFRGRRSLLLLSLQAQVHLRELPWAAPLLRRRQNCGEVSKRTAAEICSVALRGFPATILPNTFLTEIQDLLPQAPITKEVAADIFEHAFSGKFDKAAAVTWRKLRGTCYARYYGLTESDFTSGLYAACVRRCAQQGHGKEQTNRYGVGENGRIIEWQQVLTTHNLAVLFDDLDLQQVLLADLPDMAARCLQFTCRTLQAIPRKDSSPGAWRSRLQAGKNACYALRQMLFFLSQLPSQQAASFESQAAAIVDACAAPVRTSLQRSLLPRLAASLADRPLVGEALLGWEAGCPILEGL